nr:hypothetical protein [uncultured Pedobacter sp.]
MSSGFLIKANKMPSNFIYKVLKQIYTMENEENKTGTTSGTNHPKPTDDVQLEIETVTPSTEKETEKPSEALKTEEVKDEKKLNDQDEEADTTEKPAEEEKTDSDDKRDDIETATPSA